MAIGSSHWDWVVPTYGGAFFGIGTGLPSESQSIWDYLPRTPQRGTKGIIYKWGVILRI